MKICLQNLLAFSVPTFYWRSKYCAKHISGKGQLISKAIYGLLTSPKKRMDKFDLFVFSIFTENKSNSSIGFFGESRARQSAFRYYLTFSVQPLFWFRSNIKTETQIGWDFRPVWGIFSILKVPFKPDLLPNIQDFQKQKNVRKLKKKLKKKKFQFQKNKIRLQYRYRYWTLVSVPDTKTEFPSHTII